MLSSVEPDLARRLWHLTEPYHAVTYFAPEAVRAWLDAGVPGFWRGYFAGRAAPLGRVPAEVVAAALYGFHPSAMVGRAIPDVWERISPEAASQVRLAGAVAALDEALGPVTDDEAELSSLVRVVAEGAEVGGRVLFAAHAALPWPAGWRPSLWHGITLLREHRGDGHVAALVAADVDGCESHVLAAATGRSPRESTQPHRGWSDDDWSAAEARLKGRGLLGEDGAATDIGRSTREQLELATDRAASRPWAALAAGDLTRAEKLAARVVTPLALGGMIPEPNPIGIRPSTLGLSRGST